MTSAVPPDVRPTPCLRHLSCKTLCSCCSRNSKTRSCSLVSCKCLLALNARRTCGTATADGADHRGIVLRRLLEETDFLHLVYCAFRAYRRVREEPDVDKRRALRRVLFAQTQECHVHQLASLILDHHIHYPSVRSGRQSWSDGKKHP